MNNQSDFLEDLTIQQLKELLVSTYSPEEDPKLEALAERIMEVMLKKEANNPTGFFPDTETAWNELVNVYLPKTEEDREFVAHLLDDDDDDDIEPAAADLFEVPTVIPNKRKRRFLSYIAAIAAIIILLNIFTLTAYGLTLIQAVAKLGEGVFYHDSSEAAPANSLELVLQTVEGKFDTSFNFYPNWFPEGLELVETNIDDFDNRIKLTFNYESVDGKIFLLMKVFQYDGINENVLFQEQSLNYATLSKYTHNNIEHYIFENYDAITVTWSVNNFECAFASNCSIGDMERIVASIYEGTELT
jgi:hypothetical protein